MLADTRRENADEHVQFAGPGLELLRRVHVARLRTQMELLYEHGSTVDVLALCAAFDLLDRGWLEPSNCMRSQATFVEAFLGMLGFSPHVLLTRQQRPTWPLD